VSGMQALAEFAMCSKRGIAAVTGRRQSGRVGPSSRFPVLLRLGWILRS
jgi:hypothetical protein